VWVWGSESVLCLEEFERVCEEILCAVGWRVCCGFWGENMCCVWDSFVWVRGLSVCRVWESLVWVWGRDCVLCVGEFGVG